MIPPDRVHLFEALAELCHKYPNWRFGQLVANVAGWADVDVWDVEDQQMLAAAQAHLHHAAVRERDGNQPFELGVFYTREQIHSRLGGSTQSYLPHVGGRVVCACLRKDTNPQAPEIILVGTGEGIERAAEMLAAQAGEIPIFIKQDTNRWEYVGEFSFHSISHDTVEIEAESRRSGRNDITSVIHMVAATATSLIGS